MGGACRKKNNDTHLAFLGKITNTDWEDISENSKQLPLYVGVLFCPIANTCSILSVLGLCMLMSMFMSFSSLRPRVFSNNWAM